MEKRYAFKTIFALLIASLFFIINVTAQNCWQPVDTAGLGTNQKEITVRCMTNYNNKLVVVFNVPAVGTRVAEWDGISWKLIATKITQPQGLSGSINAIKVFNDQLYVTGNFDTIDGTAATIIAMWNGTNWNKVVDAMPFNILDMTIYNNHLYLAGQFTTVGGTSVNYIAEWDGTSWSNVGGGSSGGFINCLYVYNGQLYICGHFDSVANIASRNIAMWDGTQWHNMAGGVGSANYFTRITSIFGFQNSIYAGGVNIDTANGVSLNNIAKWDGNTWSNPGGGVWNNIYSMFATDTSLVVAGDFKRYNPSDTFYNIAQWNGSTWSSFDNGIKGATLRSIDTFQHALYTGGRVDSIGGLRANALAEYRCFANAINEVPTAAEVSALPNPSNGLVEFTFQNYLPNTTIEIFDLVGQRIFYDHVNADKTVVNLTGKTAGTYIYRLCDVSHSTLSAGTLVIQ